MLTIKNILITVLLCLNFSVYCQQHRIDSLNVVLKKYNQAHQQQSPSLSDSVKVILLNDLYYYHVNYKQDIAEDYSSQALALSKKIGYKKGMANSYSNLARIYNSKANFTTAMDYLQKSNKLFIELKEDLNLAYNYSEMGVVYSKQGNFPEALSILIKALKAYEKAGDTLSVGYTYVNIGISYKQQEEYAKALDYYYKAIQIFEKIDNVDAQFGIAGTYSNIGNVYLNQGKYEKSLEIHYKGLELAEEFDNSYQFAESYQSIGENYMKLGKYDTALKSFSKAIDFCNEIGDKAGISNCHINIGYCYLKKGDRAKALTEYKLGLAIAKEIGSLEWQKKAYKNLAQIYSIQGDYKQAYENQVLFKNVNDSLFNTERDKKITQMQMQYDFDKIQERARRIQQQKVLQLSQENDKQRTIKYIVMAALFCMCALAFGIFFNLKKNQRQKAIIAEQNEKLEEQNLIIGQSLTEKETLLREIHHRVKNNLQIISSLLNIQSQHILDENVLSSIQEGQSRVQAMSLIHQNLYQSEHLSNVDIENYLRELVVYLSEMFAGADKSIQVEVEANHIQFDIDTAIPLGLIVNELVSNAYKYAFENRSSGTIKIQIKALNTIDYELNVNDDGTGLPEDFDPKKSRSLGLKLVSILSRQLRGNMSSNSDSGTSFVVHFKDIKAYQLANS